MGKKGQAGNRRITVLRRTDITAEEVAAYFLRELDGKIDKKTVTVTGPTSFTKACAELVNPWFEDIKNQMLSQYPDYDPAKTKNKEKDAV